MIVSLVILGIVITIFGAFIYWVFNKEITDLNNKINWYIFIIIGLSINLFAFFFIYEEKTVYIWDFSGYWYITLSLTDKIIANPSHMLNILYGSVLHDQYNYLPSILLTPVTHFIGKERPYYIISIITIYLLPSLYFFLLLVNNLLEKISRRQLHIVLLCVSLLPCLLAPILVFGYVSIIGFIPMFLILLLFKKILKEQFSFKKTILFSFLFVAIILLRRWYGIWCIATIITFTLVTFYQFYKTAYSRDFFLKMTKTALIVAALGIGVLLIFFKDFLFLSLGTDYSDIYSAYSSNGFWYELLQSINRLGWLTFFIILFGTGYSLLKRKYILLIAATWMHLFLTIFFFSRVQVIAIHHNYLLVLDWLLLFSLSIYYITHIFKNKGTLIVLTVSALSFIYAQTNAKKLELMFTKVDMKPMVNPNMKLITDLYYYLDNLVGKQKRAIYVLASSGYFNNETINNYLFPNDYVAIDGMLKTAHVDKRDGLPTELITMGKYVLVSNKAKTHLNPDDQWVIKKFNDWIYDGRFSSYYKTLKTFENERLGKILVKERIKAFTISDINFILDEFKTKYSGYENLASLPVKFKKIVGIEYGDHWSEFSVEGKDIEDLTIKLYPGENKPTSFVYNLQPCTQSLSFKAAQYNKDKIKEQCNENGEGDLRLKVTLVDNSQVLTDTIITWKKDLTIEFNPLKAEQLKFDVYSLQTDNCDWFTINGFNEND